MLIYALANPLNQIVLYLKKKKFIYKISLKIWKNNSDLLAKNKRKKILIFKNRDISHLNFLKNQNLKNNSTTANYSLIETTKQIIPPK